MIGMRVEGRAMSKRQGAIGYGVSSAEELFAADARRDVGICGCSLAQPGPSRFEKDHAHEPTPTPYFILEDLFSDLGFSDDSHLLDVGCGTGRVLAYFADAGFPGRATGVELDPDLARFTASWTRGFANLDVIEGSAVDVLLAEYTHFYLFNPFDTVVLLDFLAAVEAQATRPVMLAHMSDNGETYFYIGRAGWSLVREGEFQKRPDDKGRMFSVYEHPQHYSIWRFEPSGLS